MLFHAHRFALNFELGGRRYVVPLGAEFEVPDRIGFLIAAHGIQAAKGPAPGEDPERVQSRPLEPKRVPLAALATSATEHEAAEELADITGEDPAEEDDDSVPTVEEAFKDAEPAAEKDDFDEGAAAERTIEEMEKQGIRVPGKRPGRRPRG